MLLLILSTELTRNWLACVAESSRPGERALITISSILPCLTQPSTQMTSSSYAPAAVRCIAMLS